MSTEENNLTLVHEDYIEEKGIDESTLPTEITSEMDALETMITQHSEMDDDSEEIDALEKAIEDKSRVIKANIVTWEVNTPAVEPIVPPVEPATPPADPNEPKPNTPPTTPPKSGTEQPPKKEEKKPFKPFWMLEDKK